MRVLMCGDRHWEDAVIIGHILDGFSAGTIVHGDAPGADSIAGMLAKQMGLKVDPHPADWERYGRAAGPKRNQEMLDSGIEMAFAFHDNLENSKGTKDMVKRLVKAGVRTYVIGHAV